MAVHGKNKFWAAKAEKFVGKTYNRWTVLDIVQDETNIRKGFLFRVRCKCGIEKTVKQWSVTSGASKSCGCLAKEINKAKVQDLLGKVYGYLTVVHRAENYRNVARWFCKCKCGNTAVVKGTSLRTKHATSCGCYNKEILRQQGMKDNLSARLRIYRACKGGAKNRGLLFDIPFDYFCEIIERRCFYCNSVGSNNISSIRNSLNSPQASRYTYNGIDRVDNLMGYVCGNVVPCCIKCNIAKRNMSQIEFAELIVAIYQNLPSWLPSN